MKTCSKCKIEKPLTEFYIQRSRGRHQSRCKECAKVSVLEWNKANPELAHAREMRYRTSHRKQYAERTAAWYLKNKKKNNENAARWYRKHPQRGNAKAAKYRATRANATPLWANQFFIDEAYDLALLRTKMLGFKWHVDHIVPLKSALVCGLHVERNLQVIPARSNISKGNRVWPDMP